MSESTNAEVLDLHVGPRPRRQEIIPSGVMGMGIFIFTELMLFAGLISAFMIVKGGAAVWPPPDQPRLPVSATAFNTAVLIASGVMLFVANRNYRKLGPAYARSALLASAGLGTFFLLFQGWEWVQLIGQGLTLTSSNHGAFFYLIVGIHALHGIAALALLWQALWRLTKGRLLYNTFLTAQVFWYFVVGIWPVVYLRVYL